jgi:hypothetical protein
MVFYTQKMMSRKYASSKYSVDEPIIYKLSEFKKTQVMKNKQALTIVEN